MRELIEEIIREVKFKSELDRKSLAANLPITRSTIHIEDAMVLVSEIERLGKQNDRFQRFK
jgi:hypothetical protein